MESCIYKGRIRHRRRRPIDHAFEFPLFMVYLDLEELPEVFRGRWLWSDRRPALARFRRGDHLGDARRPLDACVRDRVERRTGRRPIGPIRLLTHLRYAGYLINPVSFYYCFDRSGEGLEAVVAEVTNTPWGERHDYVVTNPNPCDRGAIHSHSPKELHVSPFMDLDLTYLWSLPVPGRKLEVGIANREPDGEILFDAALHMNRLEITGTSLAHCLARQPFMTAQVAGAIYWQALRLRLKGAPFHPHPGHRSLPVETTS